MSTTQSLKRSHVWWTAVIGSVIIPVLWAGSAFFILCIFPKAPNHGPFGDLFGSINALFSGYAFLGVILTIMLQMEELKEQRKEIQLARLAHEDTARQLRRQAEASEFINRIEGYNHIIRAIDMQFDQIRADTHHNAANRRRDLISEKDRYLGLLRGLIETRMQNEGGNG